MSEQFSPADMKSKLCQVARYILVVFQSMGFNAQELKAFAIRTCANSYERQQGSNMRQTQRGQKDISRYSYQGTD